MLAYPSTGSLCLWVSRKALSNFYNIFHPIKRSKSFSKEITIYFPGLLINWAMHRYCSSDSIPWLQSWQVHHLKTMCILSSLYHMSRERTRCQSSYLNKSLCDFLARPFRLTNVPSIFIGMIKALFYIYTITLCTLFDHDMYFMKKQEHTDPSECDFQWAHKHL